MRGVEKFHVEGEAAFAFLAAASGLEQNRIREIALLQHSPNLLIRYLPNCQPS